MARNEDISKGIMAGVANGGGKAADGIAAGVGAEKLLSRDELLQKARTYARATHGRVSKRPWEDIRIWRNDPEWEAAVDQMPSIRRSIPESQQAEFWTIYNEIITPPEPAKPTAKERERAEERYERENP